MGDHSLFWLTLTILSLIIQGCFSMQEMAAVSFNRIRLHYYVIKGSQRAQWINALLMNPSRLFGTTLIGVNVALQIGSECSRQFYESLGLSPDLAPITQIVTVLIFAELTPMFAARRCPEHTSMLGAPLLYGASKVLTPFIWGIGLIAKFANHLLGTREVETGAFLSRDELQKLIEGQDRASQSGEKEALAGEELNVIVENIFSTRNKTAQKVMEPLSAVQMIPSHCTVGRLRQTMKDSLLLFLPIYHRSPNNIVNMVTPREVLRAPDNHRARDYARPPWFVTANTPVLEILKLFRRNGQSVAVVLNRAGNAVGILTLDIILSHIFGEIQVGRRPYRGKRGPKQRVLDKTFPGTLLVEDLNHRYEINLEGSPKETLSQLFSRTLGHHPQQDDQIQVGNFELTATKTTLMGAKTVAIKSLSAS